MIKSFADKPTAALFRGMYVRGVDPRVQCKAQKKLKQIHAAACLDDLRIPPGNRLEQKKGKMQHLYCIRVNDQWRICFEWRGGNAYEVMICDYH